MENIVINTRGYVLDALEEVNKFRTYQTIDHPERPDLDEIAIQLDTLSAELLINDIKDVAANIRTTLPGLIALNEKILNTYSELKAISEKIEKAAKAVGVLVEIVGKATAAGLI